MSFLFCGVLCHFWFCNHLAGEKRADCFTLLCSECHVVVFIVLWLFLAVQQIGLCCVIMAIPGYTHLLSVSFILILNNSPETLEYAEM